MHRFHWIFRLSDDGPLSRPISFFLILSCLLPIGVVITQSQQSDAAEGDLSKVLSHWRERRRAVKVLSAEVEGTVTIPKGLYSHVLNDGQVFPGNTYKYSTQLSVLIDLSEGRARRRQKGMILHLDEKKFIPYCDVDFFDGREFQTLRPRADNSDQNWQPAPYDSELIEQGVKRRAKFFRTVDFPLFFSLGIIPMADLSVSPEHIKSALDSIDGTLLKAVGTITERGRELVVVRSAPLFSNGAGYYEFWIDLPRDAAIVRWCAYVNDQRATSIETSYQQIQGGWFPEAWTVGSSEILGGPEKREEFHVKKLIVGPAVSNSDFRFKPTPGMVIYKSGEERRYVVREDGIAETPLADFLLAQAKPATDQRLFWVVVVNVVAFLAVGSLVWWRKIKARGKHA
jgi:hypothetical protein